jgi:hypothetical protein
VVADGGDDRDPPAPPRLAVGVLMADNPKNRYLASGHSPQSAASSTRCRSRISLPGGGVPKLCMYPLTSRFLDGAGL